MEQKYKFQCDKPYQSIKPVKNNKIGHAFIKHLKTVLLEKSFKTIKRPQWEKSAGSIYTAWHQPTIYDPKNRYKWELPPHLITPKRIGLIPANAWISSNKAIRVNQISLKPMIFYIYILYENIYANLVNTESDINTTYVIQILQ